jgi:two-component system KDP operon response regulator KdpE
MKVLIIEDDYKIIEAVSLAFEVGWPDASVCYTRQGEEGIDLVEQEQPDVILLDLGLPDISGFEVIKRVRLFSMIPIIILSVMADEQSVVKALQWGADDYVVKPFRQLELLARVRSNLRKHQAAYEIPVKIGEISFDPSNHNIKRGNSVVHLTNTESRILHSLFLNAGKVVTYESLSNMLWSTYYPEMAEAIRSHIKNLRRKIEPDPSHPALIITRPGTGYLLAKPQSEIHR